MVQPRKDNYFIFLFSPLKQGRRDPQLLRQEDSAQGLSCSGQKLNARVFHGSRRALNVIWASSAKGCFQKLRESHETAQACSDGVEANHGPRTSDSVAKPLPKSTASRMEGLPTLGDGLPSSPAPSSLDPRRKGAQVKAQTPPPWAPSTPPRYLRAGVPHLSKKP